MPETPRVTAPSPGVDATDLRLCLEVLRAVELLPEDHPDAVAVRRATARIYKGVKEQRREARRAALIAADEAVTSATATAAPGRIDDETAGLPLAATATGQSVGTLLRARGCYVCKRRYREVDAFYHQLCPECARENWARREARCDLTGRRALLTGGRAKIGMHIALRLLRDGAHTTITTRFPLDAARRFRSLPDAGDWLHRLRVIGLDLRDPAQVLALTDEVLAAGPLDVLINNAAQTVRRSPGSYRHLVAGEDEPLEPGSPVDLLRIGRVGAHARLTELESRLDSSGGPPGEIHGPAHEPTQARVERAMLARPGSDLDAGGLVPERNTVNSWTQSAQDVEPGELLEVQLCNVTAPFLLVSKLRPALAASSARRTYVVNVSAMEGVFARGYKGPGHPHTNMAKAALNMLTRTSAEEFFSDGILMTSVDTGWITDERPHETKERLAKEGFHAPLDLQDGAARVYDPIVRGEAGEDLYGCFLKDYRPAAW